MTISAASSSAQPPPSPQTSGESIFSSPAPPEAVSSALFTGFGSTASSTGSSNPLSLPHTSSPVTRRTPVYVPASPSAANDSRACADSPDAIVPTSTLCRSHRPGSVSVASTLRSSPRPMFISGSVSAAVSPATTLAAACIAPCSSRISCVTGSAYVSVQLMASPSAVHVSVRFSTCAFTAASGCTLSR